MLKKINILALLLLLTYACGNSNPPEEDTESDETDTENSEETVEATGESNLPLSAIQLPDGFKIDIFAEVENARSMAMSPNGTIFVGNRQSDKVYALQDTDQDGKADQKFIIDEGLRSPNGVAFRNGDLYVAEISRILKYPAIEENLDTPPEPVVIKDDYPKDGHHGWKFIAFGPDDRLYVPVGAPCNICESANEVYASITSIKPDGSDMKVFAEGVRNTVGFTWHPETGDMWFTDNGRDWLGNDFPPCELNIASKAGNHYGYPYCHGGDIADPEFGGKFPCSDFQKPARNLGPHVAPLGLRFYTGNMFPSEYSGDLIIAEHGSWNRDSKIGYRLMHVNVENGKATSYEPFAEGWLNDKTQDSWGRPVDVLMLPDGSMLVSDDFADVVYRITYES
ncbi:MAG: sorbosone dehydrogenase family protein [Bacteroidota bacterium]